MNCNNASEKSLFKIDMNLTLYFTHCMYMIKHLENTNITSHVEFEPMVAHGYLSISIYYNPLRNWYLLSIHR